MKALLPSLAIAGYRSFGDKLQRFDRFAKLNFFIGQNNAGKSNILRFLSEIYPQAPRNDAFVVEKLAYHLPSRPPILLGVSEDIDSFNQPNAPLPASHRLLSNITDAGRRAEVCHTLGAVLREKARLDRSDRCWTLLEVPHRRFQVERWAEALRVLSDTDLHSSWSMLTNQTGGSREKNWEPELARALQSAPPTIEVRTVPAIRKIGARGSLSDNFDGTGLIERLAKLQNPDAHNQEERRRFQGINSFLREVVDRPDARIEIPYERDTILIHMDSKALPLDCLGSGIHEVLILAAAATVLSGTVVCMEEPELHLNPVLQRKLVSYLAQHTDNQYFISTHSAVLMDTPGAEVYHITLNGGSSQVARVTSDNQRSAVCEDLGYHPSDLLQANCILWVEGPSDRIYLNWWLAAVDGSLVEGVHYSVMFYGGRLVAHLSNADETSEVADFISLRKLNRRGFMLIDSDREGPGSRLGETKRRLRDEFNTGPGHAWITAGREIENYLPGSQLSAAMNAVTPGAQVLSSFEKFDHALRVRSARGKDGHAPKVGIARYVVKAFRPDLSILDLDKQIHKVHAFVMESNPSGPAA